VFQQISGKFTSSLLETNEQSDGEADFREAITFLPLSFCEARINPPRRLLRSRHNSRGN
jgi:hypothetical protein